MDISNDMNLSIIQEQAELMLKSPDIVPAAKKDDNPPCNCKCNINQELLTSIESRIFTALNEQINKQLRDFFTTAGTFDKQLKGLVDSKIMDMMSNESSIQDTSILDKTLPKNDNEVDQRLNYLEKKFQEITPPKVDDLKSLKKGYEEHLEELRKSRENLEHQHGVYMQQCNDQHRKLTEAGDQAVAQNVNLQLNGIENPGTENETHSFPNTELSMKVKALERQVEQLAVQIDDQEQQTRKEIGVFENIPYEGNKRFPENPTRMVINFLKCHLDIHVQERDISICHRQTIMADRKRLGTAYIAPIYCKFLNRSLFYKILEREHWLRGQFNIFGEEFSIHENLTLNRRVLWSSVQEKLDHFQFKWVKNGCIYVREKPRSRIIKIVSDHVIDELTKATPKLTLDLAKTSPDQPRSKPNPRGREGKGSLPVSAVQNRRYANAVLTHTYPSASNAKNYTRFQRSEPVYRYKNFSFVNFRSPAF